MIKDSDAHIRFAFLTGVSRIIGSIVLPLRFSPQAKEAAAEHRTLSKFEFKVVELTPEGRALAQLKERDYAAKYRALGQPIHLIGTVRRAVEFSREQRSVVGFQVETL